MAYNIIDELIGKTIIKIERYDSDSDVLEFHLSNGAIYQQYHSQDCCESVCIQDVDGDLDDLIGSTLLQAEESYSDATSTVDDDGYSSESATWTFYKFATKKGYVTIRWYGSSNGYYSETAQMEKIKDEDPIKEQRRKKLDCINKVN